MKIYRNGKVDITDWGKKKKVSKEKVQCDTILIKENIYSIPV